MKFGLLCVLAFATLANGYFTKVDYTFMKADKDLGYKQKFVLEMLRHVYQPLTYSEYFTYGKTFVDGETYYTNWLKVQEFYTLYFAKMLPRGEIFSIMNERHMYEVKGLFNLFYYSKDWSVFMKNVVWARMHMNEGMFVYAFTAAIIHRSDMYGIVLPSPYEIMPWLFIDNEVMVDAYKYKMTKVAGDDFTYVIWKNDTRRYDYLFNQESVLNYFTEDVGLNSWYYFFHMDYPFWLGSKDLGYELMHRGEKFLYFHQQLLARYYFERLSNGFGDIMEIDWTKPIVTGYYPKLSYFNGVSFPMRHNYYNVKSLTKRDQYIVKVMDYERRIRDIIDRGYLIMDDKKIDFTDYKSVDILGNFIHGNADSYDLKFYRYLDIFYRLLVGGSFETYDMKIVPSCLEHFETTLRDPVFYQLYKRIVRFYFSYKNNLPVYTADDLYFKGVKFNDVKVSKLVTYFDFYDIDITNGVDISTFTKMNTMYNPMYDDTTYVHDKYVGGVKNTYTGFKDETWKYLIKFRTLRLNHEPFTFNFDLMAEKDMKVVIRTFLGPKYDEIGRLIPFTENRENWVEFDKFIYDLKVGKNLITRTSKDFYYTIPDGTTYRELYKYVMTGGFDKTTFFNYNDYYTGFPDRLLLPKGKVNGMFMQMFFMVTPFTNAKMATTDFMKMDKYWFHNQFWDNLSLGYPFDRSIVFDHLFTFDNMFVKDVVIFHRKFDDIRINYTF